MGRRLVTPDRISYLQGENQFQVSNSYDFYLSGKYRWTVSLVLGIFIYFFLLAFLPFGVANYNPDHQYTSEFLLEMSKFMLSTMVLAAVMEVGLKPRVLSQPNLSNILKWSAFLLLILGLGNFLLYNWLGNWHDFSLMSAIEFIFNCSLVFIFPLIGTFFYFRLSSLNRAYSEMAYPMKNMSSAALMFHFKGQGSSDLFSIAVSDFKYAQAQDNYVALFYMRKGVLQKHLIRCTLAELLEQEQQGLLVRCHRSFAVNIGQVHSFSGGYPLRLYLEGVETPIRVSRSYREVVLKRLREAVSAS